MSDLDTLATELEAALQAALHATPDNASPTRRHAANLIVDARPHFTRADGQPDLAGRTWAYRQWMAQRCDNAGIAADQRNTVLSAIRFHVNNVNRDRYDTDTLAAHGMQPQSQREMSRVRRAKTNARIAALEAEIQTLRGDQP